MVGELDKESKKKIVHIIREYMHVRWFWNGRYKVAGTLNPLSGKVTVSKGSVKVHTTMDISGEIGVGDGIRIDSEEFVVKAIDTEAPAADNTPKDVLV